MSNGRILSSLKTLPFWALPFFTGFLMSMLSHEMGAFDAPKDDAALRIFNGALGFPIFVVYGWASILVMKRRAIRCLNRFTQTSVLHLAKVDFEQDIESKLESNIAWSIALGTVFTCSYLYYEDLIATDLSSTIFLMNLYALPF
jgi:hypothetical protein